MTEKDQFLRTMAKEYATTLRVLRAYPPAKADLKPHPKTKSAQELAWNFVKDETACDMTLDGGLDQGKMPKPPATLPEVISMYEAAHQAFIAHLQRTPEADLNKTVKFMTGPKQLGDMRTMDVLWFMLMDSIHHRGQMTVYLRMADGNVPSIYGPSGDEPWN